MRLLSAGVSNKGARGEEEQLQHHDDEVCDAKVRNRLPDLLPRTIIPDQKEKMQRQQVCAYEHHAVDRAAFDTCSSRIGMCKEYSK